VPSWRGWAFEAANDPVDDVAAANASRGPTSADLGNGILQPETRRRVQPREADRPAKWPSQTALDHAKALLDLPWESGELF
jgi:hypothetical protein